MGLPMIWVVVKYKKMRFLATLRRTTFYISLSRDLAVGTLLNVVLLAYVSDENFIPSKAKLIVFHNTTKIERAKKNNRGLRQTPSSTMSQS